MDEIFHTSSPDETFTIGRELASGLKVGDMIILEGDLGTGKTTLVQGIADGLCIKDNIKSPSFNIVNIYEGSLILYHIDLYRFTPKDDLDDIGIDDYLFSNDGVSVIEWGERLKALIGDVSMTIRFYHEGEDTRRIEVCYSL